MSTAELEEVGVEWLRRVRLEPGDTLILKSSYPIGREQAQTLIDQLKTKFPGHEVIYLSPNLDLQVAGPGPTDETPGADAD